MNSSMDVTSIGLDILGVSVAGHVAAVTCLGFEDVGNFALRDFKVVG